QIPGKTDFGKMCAHKLKRDPDKRRGETGQLHAAMRKAMHRPCECADQQAPSRSDQQQNSPAAHRRKTAVNREHGGNPRNRRENKKERVYETASKRDPWASTKNNDEQHSYENPRINREVKPCKGKRQCGAGDRRNGEAQGGRYLSGSN